MIEINLIKFKMVFVCFQKEFVVKIFEEEEEKGAKTQQKKHKFDFSFFFFKVYFKLFCVVVLNFFK